MQTLITFVLIADVFVTYHANVTMMVQMVRAVAILLYSYFTADITGRAIAQAVSCQFPTATARVRCHVGLFGICDGQSGTGAFYCGLPCQFAFHQLVYIH
jgi:hypothetical protein